jgi:hypothetical protein
MSDIEAIELRWVTTRGAVQLIRSAGLIYPRVIEEWAAGELVRTYAKALEVKDRPARRDYHLPKEFWTGVMRPDTGISNWPEGTFECDLRDNMRTVRCKAMGVHVCLDDLEEMLPEIETSTNNDSMKNQGGKPRESAKWDAVIVALARLANDGKLDRAIEGAFKSQADLRRAILDDPTVAALDVKEETIRATIRKVWLSVVEVNG